MESRRRACMGAAWLVVAGLSAVLAGSIALPVRAAEGQPAAPAPGAPPAQPPAAGGAQPAPAAPAVEPAVLVAKVANMLVVTNPVKAEALSLGGVSSLEVPSGTLLVLSRSPRAVFCQGVSKIKSRAAGVAGGSIFQNLAKGSADTQVQVPWTTDPLSTLPMPDVTGLKQQKPVQAGPKEELVLEPGIYPYIVGTQDAKIRLQPGTYIVTQGLGLKDHASIEGESVLLINYGGRIQCEGFGELKITAPLEGPYRGLAIYQPRQDVFPMVVNSGANITGCVYVPGATFSTGGVGKAVIGSLVADSVIVSGANTLTVEGASFIPPAPQAQ